MNRFFVQTCTFLVILLASTACHVGTKRTVTEINLLLDSLKAVYAPDVRIAYWKPELSSASEGIILGGEVGGRQAFEALQKHVSEDFTGVSSELKLLPEDTPDMQVNGLVNSSVAHIRSDPSHRAELVTQALLGTPVRILKEEKGWYLVQTPNLYLGWAIKAAVAPMDQPGLDSLRISGKIIFSEQYGFAYSKPNVSSIPVSDLVAGSLLPVRSTKAGFIEVTYPDGTVAWVKREQTMDMNDVFYRTFSGENMVQTAMKYNGIPYLWGGTSAKAIDCSGFTSIVYYMNGIVVMRDANQQSLCGSVVTTEYRDENLLPGDLLFFGRKATDTKKERVSHVAIYLGDAAFIHASENLGKVGVSSMDSTRKKYIEGYDKLFVRAVRPTGKEGDGFQSVIDNPFYMEILKPMK